MLRTFDLSSPFSRRLLQWAAMCAVGGSSLAAKEARAPLRPHLAQTIILEAELDDENFREPLSYRLPPKAVHRFVRRVTLHNTGAVPLTGRLLVVNGQDWSGADALHKSLQLPAEKAALTHRFFRFWWDHRTHATSGLKLAEDPIAILNFWGYSLCNEDAVAAPHFLLGYGVPGRRAKLIGHLASEYFYDDAWHFFDGDQNAFYLRLDNQTVASADEVTADPFLIMRTKVFGRHAVPSLAASALNASFFDRTPGKEPKALKPRPPVTTVREENLLPGERLIFHCDLPPERAVGSSNLDQWRGLREATLGLVEHRLNVKLRRDAGGMVRVATAEPILRMVNETTGAIFEPPPGEAVFEGTIAAHDAGDSISVFRQRARGAFPLFRKGANDLLLLAGDAGGMAELAVEYETHPELEAPSATLRRAEDSLTGAPGFVCKAEGERLWWQIASSPEFHVLVPNFDAVIPQTSRIELEALSATFLQPGVTYFARLRGCRRGVWGAWSPSVEFTMKKPAAPSGITASVVQGRLRLNWMEGVASDEYLVFGSNRLDFVPEIFHPQEIAQLENVTVLAQRPNQNLVAVTQDPALEFTPACRFLRIVARAGSVLSVPSELIRIPPELTGKLPPATALQTTPIQAGADALNVTYLATEAPLPEAKR